MRKLQILINGQNADLTDRLQVVLDREVSELRNSLKKTGAFSYTIKLPVTQKNKTIFNHLTEKDVIGKFKPVYSVQVLIDGVEVISGVFNVRKVTSIAIEGNITGQNNSRLADIIPDKNLNEIQSFTPLDFEGDKTVWEYLDRQLDATNSEICFPFVFDSFARMKYLNGGYINNIEHRIGYENFGVSHFTAATLRNLFADAGYSLEGDILNDETFNKMVLLYSNENGQQAPYNYGKLNPLYAETYYNNAYVAPVREGEDYQMYAITPEVIVGHHRNTGDLSFSLGTDGVYSVKHTGDYNISVRVHSYAVNVNGSTNPAVEAKQFLLFREISDSEYTDSNVPDFYNSLNFEEVKDLNTLNRYSNTTSEEMANVYYHNTTFTARLEAGKQYAPQVYFFIKKNLIPQTLRLTAANGECFFRINSVTGTQVIDPAKFLPRMKQINFIDGIFKLFNLFYNIDNENKIVRLFTRDEFFALNKGNITDLTNRVDLKGFEETPFTEQDVAETYYRWATDESDHLLTYTDYIERVNGNAPEDAYELPFAPLAFLSIGIEGETVGTQFPITNYGVDLIPCAIPATDSVDVSVLDDYEAQSHFAYKPKIALYQGAGFLKPQLFTVNKPYDDEQGTFDYLICFERTQGLTGGAVSDNYGYSYKHIPKLTFFNVTEQPVYRIETNYQLREFRIVESQYGSMYPNDAYFLTSEEKALELDKTSLTLKGEKSEFQKLYRNDLLITEWSNYAEGNIKMNPVLYSNLTGRQVLRIEQDLYLLSSIRQYDLTGDTARIKIYKLLTT